MSDLDEISLSVQTKRSIPLEPEVHEVTPLSKGMGKTDAGG